MLLTLTHVAAAQNPAHEKQQQQQQRQQQQQQQQLVNEIITATMKRVKE